MPDTPEQQGSKGVERRLFLKRAGTVAWAAPLILTVAANRASAVTLPCTPNAGPCTATAECCPGSCCCSTDPINNVGGLCAPIAGANNCTGLMGTCL
jgi:hypothetical protein